MKWCQQNNQISKAEILVLLIGVIYEEHSWESLRWSDTHTKFHEDWLGNSGNIKVITPTTWEAAVLALLTGTIYDISC
jgi:hypothetical protein